MKTLKKTTIAMAVSALVAAAPMAAQADFVEYANDTLYWSDGDITASAYTSWDAEGTSLEYTVYFDDVAETWKYEYWWSADRKALSHMIFSLTEDGDLGPFTYDNLLGGTDGGEIGNYGPDDPSNPGIPGDMYGIKFDSFYTSSDGLDAHFEIISNRGPMWGDFYAKDGVEQLEMSEKHETLLSKAEAGDLKKKQQKKLNKMNAKYARNLELLAMSEEERAELGKKARKRLRKLEARMEKQKFRVYAYNTGFGDDNEIQFNLDGSLAAYISDQILVPDSFEGRPPSEIPLPAAVWLFGSGLIGMAGVARRRKQV